MKRLYVFADFDWLKEPRLIFNLYCFAYLNIEPNERRYKKTVKRLRQCKLNCVKLYFGAVLEPSIFLNSSAKLPKSSKNSKQKILSC